jgi:hypothetical protein
MDRASEGARRSDQRASPGHVAHPANDQVKPYAMNFEAYRVRQIRYQRHQDELTLAA